MSLNPCFNGRYSLRSKRGKHIAKGQLRLNPCFNGRYSLSYNYGKEECYRELS